MLGSPGWTLPLLPAPRGSPEVGSILVPCRGDHQDWPEPWGLLPAPTDLPAQMPEAAAAVRLLTRMPGMTA